MSREEMQADLLESLSVEERKVEEKAEFLKVWRADIADIRDHIRKLRRKLSGEDRQLELERVSHE